MGYISWYNRPKTIFDLLKGDYKGPGFFEWRGWGSEGLRPRAGSRGASYIV